MHIDLDQNPPEELQTQTCIIGAGAAGITVARTLLEAGQEIVLLESGGLDYEPAISALNSGSSIGQPYYDLEHARLRFGPGNCREHCGKAYRPFGYRQSFRSQIDGPGSQLCACGRRH